MHIISTSRNIQMVNWGSNLPKKCEAFGLLGIFRCVISASAYAAVRSRTALVPRGGFGCSGWADRRIPSDPSAVMKEFASCCAIGAPVASHARLGGRQAAAETMSSARPKSKQEIRSPRGRFSEANITQGCLAKDISFRNASPLPTPPP